MTAVPPPPTPNPHRVDARAGRWDVERWRDPDKVLLVSLLTLPFAAAWLARVFQVRADPTLSPYVNRDFLPTLLPFLVAQVLGHVALIAAALVLRRRAEPRAPWLVHAQVQFWLSCMSFSLYVQGPFTSSFGVLVLALPVIGYQLFDARPMNLGLVTLLTGTALSVVLPLAGLVPYAPFVGEAPAAHGHLHPAWAVSVGLPSLFAIGVVLFIHITLMRRLKARQAQLERLSSTDALTGLANRAVFFERLEAEVARATRHALPLCVVMLDADHFKRVNDTLGHQVGDALLRGLASALRGAVRGHDVAARYGGEEFAVLLPHTTLAEARVVTTRLLEAARRVDVAGGGLMTVSLGVAEFTPGEGADGVVARADAALYQSKRDGRDRVTEAARPAPATGSAAT